MKILMLTRYGHSGASNQMHFYQYLSWLETTNIEAVILSLLSDAHIASLQRGQKSSCEIIPAYPQRLKSLLDVQSFDLVFNFIL
jgi:hypothetical protein